MTDLYQFFKDPVNLALIPIDQAGALWWLLKVGPKDDSERKAIAEALKDLDATKTPFTEDGKYVVNWSF